VKLEHVLFEPRGRIALITINRPQRMNAIDTATSAELLAAFETFRDDDALWAAVLTGAGDRAFSAGADLVSMAAAAARGEAPDFRVPFGGITRKFTCWKPIIAAINGHCLAGGLELALCCDIRIAAEHAQFGLPEVTRAIIPGAGGTQRLARAIPSSAAMQMLLTGGRFDAQWALRSGLVSEVVAGDAVLPRALEIADEICRNGPLAVRAVKEAAVRGREVSLEEGLRIENEQGRAIMASADAREGPRAFAEKRPARYEGR